MRQQCNNARYTQFPLPQCARIRVSVTEARDVRVTVQLATLNNRVCLRHINVKMKKLHFSGSGLQACEFLIPMVDFGPGCISPITLMLLSVKKNGYKMVGSWML
jgi:hypothetical protein